MDRSGKIAVFLQARIGSTRLPSKALFPLGESSAVGNAMQRLKKIDADYYVLLTDNASFTLLEKEAALYGFDIMEGPADNVLARFALAVKKYKPHTFIRATGDNPLVFEKYASLILKNHLEKDADHSWFEGMPLGAGVEVVKAQVLLDAEKFASSDYEKEHVTPYIYREESQFKLNHIKCPQEIYYPEGRITMDTASDYAYLQKIFNTKFPDIIHNNINLVSWLKKNPYPDNNK